MATRKVDLPNCISGDKEMNNIFTGCKVKWCYAKWKIRFGRDCLLLKPWIWRFANGIRWTWLGVTVVHPWFIDPDTAWAAGWDDCHKDVVQRYLCK